MLAFIFNGGPCSNQYGDDGDDTMVEIIRMLIIPWAGCEGKPEKISLPHHLPVTQRQDDPSPHALSVSCLPPSCGHMVASCWHCILVRRFNQYSLPKGPVFPRKIKKLPRGFSSRTRGKVVWDKVNAGWMKTAQIGVQEQNKKKIKKKSKDGSNKKSECNVGFKNTIN